MMKRLALVSTLLFTATPSLVAHAADRGEAKTTVAGKEVVVDYGRPLLRGRDMLGQATVGTPWRMGADAATTLKTEADLAFGASAVPKGTYVLTATKLGEGQWQMNVATNDAEKKVVASVPLRMTTAAASVEQFTIDLKGEKDKGHLALSWGTTVLSADFSAK